MRKTVIGFALSALLFDLIAKGLITEAEFKRKLGEERPEYQAN